MLCVSLCRTGSSLGVWCASIFFMKSYSAPGGLKGSPFFEPLEIEGDSSPMFLGRSQGYNVVLSSSEIALSLHSPDPGPISTLRLRLVGSESGPTITGFDRLPSESNYFVGNDPAKWRSNVPHYARTRLDGVYPGIVSYSPSIGQVSA